MDGEAIIKVADFLKPDDFYEPAHADIYDAMLTIFHQHKPIDLLTVTTQLQGESEVPSTAAVESSHPQHLVANCSSAVRSSTYGTGTHFPAAVQPPRVTRAWPWGTPGNELAVARPGAGARIRTISGKG